MMHSSLSSYQLLNRLMMMNLKGILLLLIRQSRKRYDAKEYNSNLTESSDNKLMNGWNSVVELNMNTNDEMEMIKRMKKNNKDMS